MVLNRQKFGVIIISNTTISFGAIEFKFEKIANLLGFKAWDLIPYPYAEFAYVSKKFYQWWKKFESGFSKKLKDFERKNENDLKKNHYTFTGFGNGAVTATFSALEYKMNHMESSITLITFGQPRIGDELFVIFTQRILDKVWRVTYQDDWVPNFPIEGFIRKKGISRHPKVLYRHFQKEFWIETQCNCSNDEIYLCYHTNTLHEHEDCNARKHLHKLIYPGNTWEKAIDSYKESHILEEHFGPYFGHTMFKNCPQSQSF